jgi:flagellar hook-associated protein 2
MAVSPALASPGLGSGLDVNSIVSKLMEVEQRPLAALDTKEARYQAQLTAFGSLKGALTALQGTMQNLSAATRFQGVTAKAADPAIFTATAAATAAAGTYTVSVANVAQSHVLAAGGVADMHTASSTGTLTLQVGSGAAVQVTLDASNNTLAGLRDAINAAQAGVTATIVNDGSASPYRLVLTAEATGAANTIQVTNNLTAGELHDAVAASGQVRPPLDAALTVNGVPVTSATNTVTDAVAGVTLNLLKDGATTFTVSRDTAAVQAAVASFVKAYNDVNTTVASLTAYNPATKQAGALLGDATVRHIQTRLRSTLTQALSDTGGSLTVLSQAGVSFQKDGSLALDSAKLTAAINDHFPDLASLFSVQGRSTDALMSFVSSTSATQTGAYQVTLTAAATRGAATAANAAAASTVIDGTNDGFSVKVNGIASGALVLAHGTYTQTQLAAALQSAINGAEPYTDAGLSVAVSVAAGRLAITSQTYGAVSGISTVAGTALAALGFDGSETGTGTDVQGSFVLGGVGMTAVGSGQVLSGVAGTAAEGLRMRYTGTPGQMTANPVSTFTFSEGFAVRLYDFATATLATDGTVAGRTSGINSSIKDLGTRRDAIVRRLELVEANIRAQFTALDTLVARMNSTSSFLTQQLAGLAKLSES